MEPVSGQQCRVVHSNLCSWQLPSTMHHRQMLSLRDVNISLKLLTKLETVTEKSHVQEGTLRHLSLSYLATPEYHDLANSHQKT